MLGRFKKKVEQALKSTKEGWFGKIAELFDRSAIDNELWDQLEELLITADVGAETSDNLLQQLKKRVKKENIADTERAYAVLREEIANVVRVGDGSVVVARDTATPWVILVVGVNGSGKTTSIGKLAYNFEKEGKKVILAAADTFRAAAIEQLHTWGDRTKSEVVAHQPNADPGAVTFDALQAAKSRGAHMVIVDTAGRLHTKFNLMEELKKIKRAAQKVESSAPNEVLLVLDATTGQNGLSQAKHFTEAVGVDGIILTKIDSTAKGGIVLAICDQLQIPIRYIGTGEGVDDLIPFDADMFAEVLTGRTAQV